jgi:hypothetical protein
VIGYSGYSWLYGYLKHVEFPLKNAGIPKVEMLAYLAKNENFLPIN